MDILSPFQKGKKIILTVVIVGAISLAFLLFFVPSIYGQADNLIKASELVSLTNQARVNYNLNNLTINPLLTKAAYAKAENLLKNDYFSHNSPDGKKFSAWVREADYTYTVVGENLAMGFSSNEAIINAWMQSPKHRENILRPEYNDIGLAVLKGRLEGQITYVIVQYFGANNNLRLSENLLPYAKAFKALRNYFVYS